MKYPSTRLGEFTANQGNILNFVEGLYAFEDELEYALLPFDPKNPCPLNWLHSINSASLAFVVTNPFLYMPDYKPDLTPEDKREIALGPNDVMDVLVIVTIPEDYTKMTGNFLAPVVVNTTRLICKQFILSNPEYETRHYLFPEAVRSAKL